MEFRMQNIIDTLEEGMKKHSSLSASFRKELISFLTKNSESLLVIKSKFVFNLKFYDLFTQTIEKKSDGQVADENGYYKNFNRLKRFKLIHKKSAYFSKALSLRSINPTHISLLTENFNDLDLMARQRKNVINNIFMNNNDSIVYLYIYLRIFALQTLDIATLQKMSLQNIIHINNNMLIHYIDDEVGIFKKNEAYHLYIYDNEIVHFLSSLPQQDTPLFEDIQFFENAFLTFKQKHLKNIHIVKLKYLTRNIHLFYNAPVYLTTYAKMIPTVKLTISEINKLAPNKVPQHLLEKEDEYIKAVFFKNRIDADEIDTIANTKNTEEDISGFRLSELEELMVFMRANSNALQIKQVNRSLREIAYYLRIDNSIHAKMFLGYIRYLLELHLKRKLRASTVRGYIWTLNKHLLKNIEDLNDIQNYEIENLHNKLNSGRYKLATIKQIGKILNRFFKFHAKKGIKFDTITLAYPKSLIFFDEYKEILSLLEQNMRAQKSRLGKYDKLELLQQKAIVILAYYSGMRKNELRTRMLSDFHLFENELYVDVNNNGLRKQKLKLKTTHAKRRIQLHVDKASMGLLKEWYSLRTQLIKRSEYLFLKRSKNGSFLNKVITEDIFDKLNICIKKVTNRYATFHSFRHSYATFNFKNIINGSTQPYALIEQAVQTGHETPEMTLNSYVHADLLRVIQAIEDSDRE